LRGNRTNPVNGGFLGLPLHFLQIQLFAQIGQLPLDDFAAFECELVFLFLF
jgi:hypothetical protein